MKEYWQPKHNISDEAWEDIDWDANKIAYKESSVGQRRQHAKYITGHRGTGRSCTANISFLAYSLPYLSFKGNVFRIVVAIWGHRCGHIRSE